MKTGKVRTWDTVKGWGFIEGKEGWDYFVNIEAVRPGHKLNVGDRVKFDVFEGVQGPSAENVALISK